MKELEKVIKEAYINLESVEETPFSDKGFIEFRNQISQFIIQLFDESFRIARRSNVEIVSPTHIKTASNNIKKTNSTRTSILKTLGGLLLGASLSNILSISFYSVSYSPIHLILTILFGITGSFLLGFNLFRS